jgi:TolB-like protein/Tfp pilus assembly protein PilF
MPAELAGSSHLEIGHVLFIDIVGYSKLLSDKQRELFHLLNNVVSGTAAFRAAEQAGKLVCLPTGDGMVLVFFSNVDAPVRCAQEVSRKLREHPQLLVRMGINSGPVDEVRDVNNRPNVTGAGINLAQRVMDCGDAGHILLSRRVADDLAQYSKWQPYLHELGDVEVKHGARVVLANFFGDDFGNPRSPSKLTQAKKARRHRISAWAAAALLLLLCLTIGSWAWTRRAALTTAYKASVAGISEKSIAVLPLENLSEEEENAYFADGIQDELLGNLGKIKDLKVISRSSVMQYKTGITRNLKEIAQQLGVSKVVEGSVRRSGNRVRVAVQLIDAISDRHIWSENYDRTMADSLTLEGELATEIASEVGATLSPQEKARVQAPPTKNTAAYDAYLRGRALNLSAHPSNFERAAQSFQEATTLDPSFGLAWVYLSCADSSVYWNGIDATPARLTAAKNALDRALAIDPNLPETHLALGYYRYYGLRDFTGALSEFQIAEKSLPNNVDVLRAIGWIQRRLGHWDEAIAAQRRAFELDPRNIDSAIILANSYAAKRNFSDALAMCDHILAVDPSNTSAIWLKTSFYWAMGNLDGADQFLANIKDKAPVHLRAHQAFNKRQYVEAADLFSKALNEKPEADEKRGLLMDFGLVQRRLGNAAASKAAYQQAVEEITQALSKVDVAAPTGAEILHSTLGVAYAGLGDAAAAVSEGKKGMAMQPTSEDPFEGPAREEQMAQIYSLLGNAEEAIPILKRWIQLPSSTSITPTLLRINPIWDPIRNDPRFVELTGNETR